MTWQITFWQQRGWNPVASKILRDIAYFFYAQDMNCVKHELCNKYRTTSLQLNCFAAVFRQVTRAINNLHPHRLISRFKKFITTRKHSSRIRFRLLANLTVRDSVTTTTCQYRWGVGNLRSHGIPTPWDILNSSLLGGKISISFQVYWKPFSEWRVPPPIFLHFLAVFQQKIFHKW